MSIRIFKTEFELRRDWIDTRMFFDINGQSYKYVDSIDDCDFLLVDLQSQYQTYLDYPKTKLFLEIFSNYENQTKEIDNYLSDRDDCLIISNAFNPAAKSKIIFNDFLFNRTKAYYFKFPFSQTTKLWYYNKSEDYIIPDITIKIKNKIYVAPNKTYLNLDYRNIIYRPQIVKILKEKYFNFGYVGNPDDSDLNLVPNSYDPYCQNLQDLLMANISFQGNYSPPHNLYYQDSFLSIYGETVEHGSDITITEKTYEPLIKGHFILPFSTSGLISRLIDLGFRFPTFIDYGYDSIEDSEKRFNLYTKELHRLLNISLNSWQDFYENNLEILKHNQNLFKNKTYDTIDFHQFLSR